MILSYNIGHVYTLSYAEDVFYVGSTINIWARHQAHVSNGRKGDEPVYQYMRLINKIPEISSLEEIRFSDIKELREAEEYWIDQLRQWGYSLKNDKTNLCRAKKKSIVSPTNIVKPLVITQKEALMKLGISVFKLNKLVQSGDLRKYKIGSANRYKVSEIELIAQ